MAELTFNDLVQKMLEEPAFRKGIENNPQATLEAIGVEPTDAMIETLESVDYDAINRTAVAFGQDPNGPT